MRNHQHRKNQCLEILLSLKENRSLNTMQARKCLGIQHPSGRIMELRKQGYNIVTHWSIEYDTLHQPHRIAEYVLLPGKYKGGGRA